MKKFITIIFVLLFLFNLAAKAQENLTFTCTTENPTTERDFKRWAEKDVGYIITKTEKEAFFKLKTDVDRNTFIENFWKRRDPDPDTEENEFKEEYCERVAGTKQFASGIPGWRTDRGIVYILFGKPDKITKGRTNFKGLKDILFESWFYKNLDITSSEAKFTFFDSTESNEFRLPKEKKDKVLNFLGEGLIICFMCPKNPF